MLSFLKNTTLLTNSGVNEMDLSKENLTYHFIKRYGFEPNPTQLTLFRKAVVDAAKKQGR